MNDIVQLHPEDLLDKHYAGSIDDEERRRLRAHLADCPSCRLEVALGDDLAAEEQESDEDLSHLVLGAVPSRPRRLRGARWLWALAAVVVVGSASAAYLGARAGAPSRDPSPAGRVPVESGEIGPSAVEPSSPAPEREPEDVAPEESSDREAASSPEPTSPTAGSLFAAGNEARRGGRRDEALRRYRRLVQLFPDSREARLAHAMIAELVADDDPEAAVSSYDEYLDDGGRLGEEALVGRAEALGRLGETQQEAATWRELLRRYPDSLHRGRAAARLETLAKGAK